VGRVCRREPSSLRGARLTAAQSTPDDHPAEVRTRRDGWIGNHRKGGVTDIYDPHKYANEDRRIMAAVARHILSIVEGKATSNVVNLR
jgi:hypothetical protein